MPLNGEVGALGGGSDYEGFLNFLGVPSMDMGFAQIEGGGYATYHSNYDSFAWMSRFGDPTFQHFAALAQVWRSTCRRFAGAGISGLSAWAFTTAREYLPSPLCSQTAIVLYVRVCGVVWCGVLSFAVVCCGAVCPVVSCRAMWCRAAWCRAMRAA